MELTEEQVERVRDFVAALRSGEYVQIPEQLGKVIDAEGNKGYCCEGVAVERYGAQLGYRVEWDEGELALNDFTEFAPNDFWRALGLVGQTYSPSTSSFTFILPGEQTAPFGGQSEFTYMSLNDDGFTFAQIADLVEWQFLS